MCTWKVGEQESKLTELKETAQELQESNSTMKDGWCYHVCIDGCTNSGKSSLFNALVGALVSPIGHRGAASACL